jgi:hypothetical protein
MIVDIVLKGRCFYRKSCRDDSGRDMSLSAEFDFDNDEHGHDREQNVNEESVSDLPNIDTAVRE